MPCAWNWSPPAEEGGTREATLKKVIILLGGCAPKAVVIAVTVVVVVDICRYCAPNSNKLGDKRDNMGKSAMWGCS